MMPWSGCRPAPAASLHVGRLGVLGDVETGGLGIGVDPEPDHRVEHLGDDEGHDEGVDQHRTHGDDLAPQQSRIAEEDPSITYLPTVTREPADSDWKGLRGRITEHLDPGTFEQLAGFKLDPETSHIFMCGNPAMIDQCEGLFTGLGYVVKDRKNPEGNVHFERYW